MCPCTAPAPEDRSNQSFRIETNPPARGLFRRLHYQLAQRNVQVVLVGILERFLHTNWTNEARTLASLLAFVAQDLKVP